MKTLAEFLSEHRVPVEPTFAKKFQRYSTSGESDDDSGWLWSSDESGRVVICGNWKTGEKSEWFEGSAEGRKAFVDDGKYQAALEAAAEERRKEIREAARYALTVWAQGDCYDGVEPTEYLKRKKIEGLHGAAIIQSSNYGDEQVIVPMRDLSGALVGIQRIFNDGKKRFLRGQKVMGAFHVIGELKSPLILCEGFATGCSLRQILGGNIVVCFSASNLVEVASVLKDFQCVVAADNDRNTEGNPGIAAAEKTGLGWRAPLFGDASKGTDWNDLYCEDGAAAVHVQWNASAVEPAKLFHVEQSASVELEDDEEMFHVEQTGEVFPLGFSGTTFYYCSTWNKFITQLAPNAHTPGNLYGLAPRAYWNALYPAGKEGERVNWDAVQSDLMEKCRKAGLFDAARIRGRGAWREGSGILLHLGERLFYDGKFHELEEPKGKHVYSLSHPLEAEALDNPLTAEEGRKLREACDVISWSHPSAAPLFAGFLALMRVSGALKWRPHLWVTGAAGSGKTTVMDMLVKVIAGEWGVQPEGSSSEAGIRQTLSEDARPVIFDEAEQEDKDSVKRMKRIVHLIRQSSSAGSGAVVKGTPGGKAMTFRMNSSFVLASIRVALVEEQDIRRFTVVEVTREKKNDWPTVQRALRQIDARYAERLFARMVQRFSQLDAAVEVFYDALQERLDNGIVQQYSALLAGLWTLENDAVPSLDNAVRFASDVLLESEGVSCGLERDEDERSCLQALMGTVVTVQGMSGTERVALGDAVIRAAGDRTWQREIEKFGVAVDSDFVFVANHAPELVKIFHDTKWNGGTWGQSLVRLVGARAARYRYPGGRLRCVKFPLDQLNE